MDGFKVLVVFQSRFDVKTVGGVLQSFQEVVSPVGLKEEELAEGTHKWEAKDAAVETQYGERPDRMMPAIFLGMIPKEYKQMALRSQNLLKSGASKHSKV